MATGDQNDIASRVKLWEPTQWFPAPTSPLRDAHAAGAGGAFVINYGQIAYTVLQTRVATLTDGWVDVASQDYLGPGVLPRRINESDAAFSLRIRLAVFAPKLTRTAIIQAVQNLTGRAPKVFNPARPSDTGGYGFLGMTEGTGLAYGSASGSPAGAGGYGSLLLPYQFFIIAFRPILTGVPYVGGYYAGSGWAGGGYGVGALEYVTLAMAGENVPDALIYSTLNSIIAAGITAWTRIQN